MTTEASNHPQEPNRRDNSRRTPDLNTDPYETADRRAEETARQFRRDLRKKAMLGAAFAGGKEAMSELIHMLTQH